MSANQRPVRSLKILKRFIKNLSNESMKSENQEIFQEKSKDNQSWQIDNYLFRIKAQ